VVTLLTRAGGILSPINNLLGLIMNGIFEFFNFFGVQNIALSIIIFTFIVRALMLPLTIRQQKFTKLSSRMSPELQKIQAKYKGKRDEASLRKQQTETQAVYQKYGANPTSGCLPLLITLPIMFALYSIVYNIPAYVGQIKDIYEPLAEKINASADYQTALKTIAETAKLRYTDISSTNHIISVLSQFGTEQWNALSGSLSDISNVILEASDKIKHVNSFLGLNISNRPGWGFPGIIIPILAAVFSFIQSKQVQVKNTGNSDNPAASAMNSMMYIMPIMQFFFCVTFPIGIGIYWIATSVFMIIQQYFVNKYLDKVNVDELIEKSVAKASKKRKRIEAAGGGMSLQELARKQTKNIENTITDKAKYTNKSDSNEKQAASEESAAEVKEVNEPTSGPKSISEIANLLKNRK
jgi:YidC/Oxa1 family membrane protein insertase